MAERREQISPQLLKILSSFQIGLIVLVGVLAAVVAVQSLFARIQHDAPMVLYPGYLFINGYGVPYRDIFDINMPGSFFLYGLIGKVFGYKDLTLRALDVFLLVCICLLGRRLCKPLGARGSWFGPLNFALFYLANQWWFALQRETFILLFVLVAANLVVSSDRWSFAVGILAGFATLIKPQALLPFVWLLFWDVLFRRKGLQKILSFSAGFALPIAGTFIYMASSGALPAWVDLVRNYLPLYAQISGDIRVIEPGQKFLIIVKGLALIGGYYLLALAAVFAAALVYNDEKLQSKPRLTLILGLLLCFWIYPAFSGQFWLYHWIPFTFFALLLLGTAFGDLNLAPMMQSLRLLLFASAVLISSLLFIKPAFFKAFAPEPPPKQGRVDEIVEYLKPRLRPGDTVQPLDWTGGAVHAMLILRARLATRYMQDFYFYHHVSSSYIQGLRADFMQKFVVARPRWVLRVLGDEKPWVSGPDTTRSFPELESVLRRDYIVVKERGDYQILERKGS